MLQTKTVKVAIVESDILDRELISLFLKKNFGVDTFELGSLGALISEIESGRRWDIILTEVVYSSPNVVDFMQILQKHRLDIPVIALLPLVGSISEDVRELNFAAILNKPMSVLQLKSAMTALIRISDLDASRGYIEISLRHLQKVGAIPASCFLRLSDDRYLKVFHPDHQFTADEIGHYAEKGLSHLWIEIEKLDGIIESYLRSNFGGFELDQSKAQVVTQMMALAEQVHDIEAQQEIIRLIERADLAREENRQATQAIELNAISLRIAQQAIRRLGVTQEVLSLIRSSQQSIMVDILNSSDIANMIAANKKRLSETYLSQHSILVGQMAGFMASRMGWVSRLNIYKLALAGFLHDLYLDSSALAFISSQSEFEELPEKERLKVLMHPQLAADLARTLTWAPPDVARIVEEHHENALGTGFPKALPGHLLSPLSSVFIIAHDAVDYLLMRPGQASIDQFLKSHTRHYQTGVFKKIFDTISGPAHQRSIL